MMKMLRVLKGTLLVLLLPMGSAMAQNPVLCGTADVLAQMKQSDPKLDDRMRDIEAQLQRYMSYGMRSGNVITIPIVVHIIHNGDPIGSNQNITDAQVQSQIDVLNKDFRRQNADTVNTPASFLSDAADSKIEFCLAQQDPNGAATNGILRYNYNQTSYSTSYIEGTIKPATIWSRNSYLNIWVMKLADGYLGYSTFPGASANQDGVVVDHRYFGKYPLNPNNTNYSLGRTTTHEIGHWLNLLHTFNAGCGSDCATTGDRVCDTPPVSAANYGCSQSATSCGVISMVQNYMDYSDDACMNLFTKGQRDRMIATLNGTRSSLLNSIGCVPVNGPPVPDFISNSTLICPSESVQFTDMSTNGATSWSWTFSGGSPASSSIQNPVVSYNSNGIYSVTLIATNANGSQNITKSNYITVDNSGTNSPFYYSFSSGVLQPAGWSLENTDNGKTWELKSTKNASNNIAKVAYMNNHNYNSSGQEDHLTTENIDLSGLSDPVLIFNVAYAQYSSQYADGLKVSVSNDCGTTFDPHVYDKAGSALATAPNSTSEWFPMSASDWRSDTVPLSQYLNDVIQFKFTNVNGYGNNLYLDDIHVADRASMSVPCTSPTQLSVSNVQETSVVLDWEVVNGALDYTIRAKGLTETSWITIDVNSGNSYQATGLNNSMLYEWQVRSNCNAGGSNVSNYSQLDTFGLAASNCNLPSNISAVNIEADKATLQWDLNISLDEYLIHWKDSSESSWTEVTVDALYATLELETLEADTKYEWKIQSVCDEVNDITSGFSAIMDFRTQKIDSTNVGIDKIESEIMFIAFPNPVGDILNISLEQPKDELMIEIVDVAGKSVRKLSANYSNFITINMKEFSKGVYMLKLSTPNINVEEKIIKL
ncbi:MAG: T9SS type A sorting domain-containing protein [Chitinophagales bacterium]|nr:T9SS type A sorting domain-containing protein [Chitinophagales bacterium]